VYNLKIHTNTCKALIKINASENNLLETKTILIKSTTELENIEINNEFNKLELSKYKDLVKEKDTIIHQLITQLAQKDKTIERITRKQSRPQIKDQNVVYVLTTPFLEEQNIYIVGKAINLTTRLSTYNKSEEHKIVYYKQCKDEFLLNTTENVILSKLAQYKHQGNRDRFTLPKDTNISLFTDIINECVNFLN
jgi:hypothetical protein